MSCVAYGIRVKKTVNNSIQLVWQLTKQQLSTRHSGSFFGFFWLLMQPLVMLVVYVFVFSGVLGLKWGGQQSPDMFTFALGILCGMLIFSFVSEVLIKASSAVLSHPNFVKKVQFPLHLLIMSQWLSSIIVMLFTLLVLLVGLIIANFQLHISVLLLPFLFLPVLLMTLGISWLLSALSVYFRDLVQLLPPLMTMLMFLSPIFYSVSMVPENFQQIILLNPLSWHIESIRNLLMFHELPSLMSYLIWLASSLFMAWFGYVSFAKLKKGFADVL